MCGLACQAQQPAHILHRAAHILHTAHSAHTCFPTLTPSLSLPSPGRDGQPPTSQSKDVVKSPNRELFRMLGVAPPWITQGSGKVDPHFRLTESGQVRRVMGR